MLNKTTVCALLFALAATTSCVRGEGTHASARESHFRAGPLGELHGFHHNKLKAASADRRPLSRGGRGNLRRLSSRDEYSSSGTGASVYADWTTAECDQSSSFSLSASTTRSLSTSGETIDNYASMFLDLQTDCSAESTTRQYISLEMYGADQPFTLNVDPSLGSASFSTTSNASISVDSCTITCITEFIYNYNDTTMVANPESDGASEKPVDGDVMASYEYCYPDNCTSVSQDFVQAVVQLTWTATDPPANSSSTNEYSDATSYSQSTYKSQDRKAAVSFSLSLDGEEYALPEQANLSGSVYSSSGNDVFVYY